MTTYQNERAEFSRAAAAVALGRLSAFEGEAHRLADLAHANLVRRIEAIDALHDIAVAHDLYEIHRVDFIQAVLADAFATDADINLRRDAA
ncbi:MAG: hypothetical protein WBA66_02780 [Xanthobacteraceae bacterium]